MNDQDIINTKSDLYGAISDMSKEVQGVRARFDIARYTVIQMFVIYDRWVKWAEEEYAESLVREQEDIVSFEALITSMVLSGAKDRTTALRWLVDASYGEFRCATDMEYDYGLPYGYIKDFPQAA